MKTQTAQSARCAVASGSTMRADGFHGGLGLLLYTAITASSSEHSHGPFPFASGRFFLFRFHRHGIDQRPSSVERLRSDTTGRSPGVVCAVWLGLFFHIFGLGTRNAANATPRDKARLAEKAPASIITTTRRARGAMTAVRCRTAPYLFRAPVTLSASHLSPVTRSNHGAMRYMERAMTHMISVITSNAKSGKTESLASMQLFSLSSCISIIIIANS